MFRHSTSRSFVKKKAALTLLRLYRKHPEVIPAAEWALRIVSIMDDHNLVRGNPFTIVRIQLTRLLDHRESLSLSQVSS